MTIKLNYHPAFEIIKLTNRLKAVERRIPVPDLDRLENTAEHSYQLAMLVWYLGETMNLTLDLNQAIRYALVHDLVEAYAGDICLFSPPEAIALKKQQEAEAIKRIEREFPDLVGDVAEYEARVNLEAQFVFFCDRLAPFINDLLCGMTSSISKKVTVAQLRERVLAAQTFPGATEVLEELIDLARLSYANAGAHELL